MLGALCAEPFPQWLLLSECYRASHTFSAEVSGSYLLHRMCSAGPAPDSEPEMGEDEMIGEESDSDSGNAAAEQRDRPPVSKPEAAQQKRQRLTPRGDSSHSRKGDSIHASRSAGGGETAAPQRHQSKMSSAGQDSAKRDRGGSDRAETDLEHDSEHEHEEEHSADEPLGRKQKRGKKKKPASQLQRVQAEVQSKKASVLLVTFLLLRFHGTSHLIMLISSPSEAWQMCLEVSISLHGRAKVCSSCFCTRKQCLAL